MVSNLYLAAHCTNAVSIERAQLAFSIVSQSETGEWEDALGNSIIPFWVEPFTAPSLTIPAGWIEHVQREACKSRASVFDLARLLPEEPKEKVYRRF